MTDFRAERELLYFNISYFKYFSCNLHQRIKHIDVEAP